MTYLTKLLQAQADNHLTDIGPTIMTRAEFIEDARKQHESWSDQPFTAPVRVPDILVIWESNNDGYASITIELWDIEDGEGDEHTYDAHFSVTNNDNVGPTTMLAQLQRCVEQFYAMGLNTKFGRIIGE